MDCLDINEEKIKLAVWCDSSTCMKCKNRDNKRKWQVSLGKETIPFSKIVNICKEFLNNETNEIKALKEMYYSIEIKKVQRIKDLDKIHKSKKLLIFVYFCHGCVNKNSEDPSLFEKTPVLSSLYYRYCDENNNLSEKTESVLKKYCDEPIIYDYLTANRMIDELNNITKEHLNINQLPKKLLGWKDVTELKSDLFCLIKLYLYYRINAFCMGTGPNGYSGGYN